MDGSAASFEHLLVAPTVGTNDFSQGAGSGVLVAANITTHLATYDDIRAGNGSGWTYEYYSPANQNITLNNTLGNGSFIQFPNFNKSTASYISIRTTNQSNIKLSSLDLSTSAYDGTLTITGYDNGAVVSGASGTLNIVHSTNVFSTFTANTSFQNIDEFRITSSDVTALGIGIIKVDNIVTAPA